MSNGGSGDFLKGMLIGGMVGAVVALLYAPKSGKETRQDIGKKADELASKAKEEYEIALEKSKKTFQSALDRLKELEGVARKKVEEVEGQVQELAEKSKETVEASKSRLKKAIDAGVETYKEEKETKKKKS
ncbi:MAG: YtxH domain-containing protein [bacterium]|nr:MAG: YtxH domain-containing protein [bacterium]